MTTRTYSGHFHSLLSEKRRKAEHPQPLPLPEELRDQIIAAIQRSADKNRAITVDDGPLTWHVQVGDDYDADISYLGTFTQKQRRDAFDRLAAYEHKSHNRARVEYPLSRDMRYFLPANRGEASWYTQHGYSRHEAAMLARATTLDDWKQAEDYGHTWGEVYYSVALWADGAEIARDGCGGYGMRWGGKEGQEDRASVDAEVLSACAYMRSRARQDLNDKINELTDRLRALVALEEV